MIFAAFDMDGMPLRKGTCPDHAFELQRRDGERLFVWSFDKGDPADWRVVDGELLHIGETMLREK